MASDFKFGAKLKLFGEHSIVIEPNADRPSIVEYHDEVGIAVTRDVVTSKLKITNETLKSMIPERTRITDFVLDRKSKSVELGVIIEPGEDFVLNKYKNIFSIDEVSLYYTYNPSAGHNLEVKVDGNVDLDTIKKEAIETATEVIANNSYEEELQPMEEEPMNEEEPMEEEPIEEDPIEEN
jgi:hypothetical protein